MNILAIVAATVAMFAVGAVWYMGLFGKTWGQIHGFDKLSPAEQKAMQAKVAPLYIVQLAVTVVSAAVLAKLIDLMPTSSAYTLAFWIWLGFVFPAQVSANLFGGSDPKWLWQKTFIMTAESLVHLEVAAWVLLRFNA